MKGLSRSCFPYGRLLTSLYFKQGLIPPNHASFALTVMNASVASAVAQFLLCEGTVSATGLCQTLWTPFYDPCPLLPTSSQHSAKSPRVRTSLELQGRRLKSGGSCRKRKVEAGETCRQLRIVKLPTTVVRIEECAFRGCHLLNSVDAPGL